MVRPGNAAREAHHHHRHRELLSDRLTHDRQRELRGADRRESAQIERRMEHVTLRRFEQLRLDEAELAVPGQDRLQSAESRPRFLGGRLDEVHTPLESIARASGGDSIFADLRGWTADRRPARGGQRSRLRGGTSRSAAQVRLRPYGDEAHPSSSWHDFPATVRALDQRRFRVAQRARPSPRDASADPSGFGCCRQPADAPNPRR